jgi:hypothetical protein
MSISLERFKQIINQNYFLENMGQKEFGELKAVVFHLGNYFLTTHSVNLEKQPPNVQASVIELYSFICGDGISMLNYKKESDLIKLIKLKTELVKNYNFNKQVQKSL